MAALDGFADYDIGDVNVNGKKKRGPAISWIPVLPTVVEGADTDEVEKAALLANITPHEKQWMERFSFAFGVHKQASSASSFTLTCKKKDCPHKMRVRQDKVTGTWQVEVKTLLSN